MNSKKWLKFKRYPLRAFGRYKENKLLKDISGIVHVGANRGQEIVKYNKFDLDVLWIEPIPELIRQLTNNIRFFKKQKAIQALITDEDHKSYEFHIANNNGASSSIYDLKEHKEVWPHVSFDRSISLQSITLSTLFENEGIDPAKYQGLVMDTQGSELLVLKGAQDLLKHFNFIKTEVADFELYEDCCQLEDIDKFMTSNGFMEYSRVKFGRSSKKGGQCYNIIYKRKEITRTFSE